MENHSDCNKICIQSLPFELILKKLQEKFWSRVIIKEKDECWIWKGEKNKKNYGNIKISINKKIKNILTHRASWILKTKKEIPT
jgi:hypothetical protein